MAGPMGMTYVNNFLDGTRFRTFYSRSVAFFVLARQRVSNVGDSIILSRLGTERLDDGFQA